MAAPIKILRVPIFAFLSMVSLSSCINFDIPAAGAENDIDNSFNFESDGKNDNFFKTDSDTETASNGTPNFNDTAIPVLPETDSKSDGGAGELPDSDVSSSGDTETNSEMATDTFRDSGDTNDGTHDHPGTEGDADSNTGIDSGIDTNFDTPTDSEMLFPAFDTGTVVLTGGYDSRPVIVPTLYEVGGGGNISAIGDVAAPTPSDGGACNFGQTTVYNYAAINVNHQQDDGLGQWQDGRICGECVRVSVMTADGLKHTVVRIMEKCADDKCGIQIGAWPAQRVMGDFPGIYWGYWEFVPCKNYSGVSDGNPAIFIKEGSDSYWSLIQIRNAPASVKSIKWEMASGNPGTGERYLSYRPDVASFYEVPLTVLQTRNDVTLTIEFNFGITIVHTLPGNSLGVANTTIELPDPS